MLPADLRLIYRALSATIKREAAMPLERII